VVAAAVGPIRDAASRELARRDGGAVALAELVDPELFTRLCVKRDDGAARASGGVKDAFHDKRWAFEFVLGPGTQVVGFEAPRDLEFVEIRRVDLVEWRVLRALQIRGVIGPVAVLCGRLLCSGGGREREAEKPTHIQLPFLTETLMRALV